MRLLMTSKPLQFDPLNKLIQTCVESGIYQFYSRWESYLRRLTLRTSDDKNHGYDSDMITMDHIWIYIYGYCLAMGLCTAVFVGEILHFHRKRILDAVGRVLTAIWNKVKTIQNHFCLFGNAAIVGIRKCLKRVRKRIFPYSMLPVRTNRITPIQRPEK